MKLYYYQHCPFCIRVLMLIAYKQLNIELVVLDNDDEKTPISMIGKKMLPILQKNDGSYLPESLDIIEYLDKLSKPTIKYETTLSPEGQNAFDDMMPVYRQLVFPRMPQDIFQEFKTASAREYFTKKKEEYVGPFSECISNTKELIEKFNEPLNKLGKLIKTDKNNLTQEDIIIFPWLYLLKLVKELKLPEEIANYLEAKEKQFSKKDVLPFI